MNGPPHGAGFQAAASAEARGEYASLVANVRRFGSFARRWAVLHGLAWTILLGPGALLIWFAADWAFQLPAWPLLILFAVAAGLGVWALVARLMRPMLRRIRPAREAIEIERLHGGLDNQVIGSLQLGEEVELASGRGDRLGYAPVLVWALVARTRRTLESQDVRKLVDLRAPRRCLLAAGAVVLAAATCATLARGAVVQRAERLADAWAAVLDSLLAVEMQVRPGDVAVVRGRSVELGVSIPGARRRAVRLVRTETRTRQTFTRDLKLEEQKAAYTLADAQESFQYHFEYGGRSSRAFRVLVDSLPAISAINYELTYPAYTGQSPRTLMGLVAKLGGLTGTNVLVSLAASTDLSADLCYVQWQDGQRQMLSVSGRFAHFSFTIDRADRATIHLTGALGRGFEMAQPASFEVVVQRHEPPTIRALLNKKNLTMLPEEAAAFGVKWIADDDFGVSEVGLEYRIDTIDPLLNRPVRQSSVSRRIEPSLDHVSGQFLDTFKSLTPPLQPGDRITITLTAKNNNTETGPGLGRSGPIEIVVVQPNLAAFTEKEFGFGASDLLGGLKKVKRVTDLLVDPPKTVRTESRQEEAKQNLKSRVSQELWPSGSEDAVGDYFQLLSGGK